jgi:hypothetical protein
VAPRVLLAALALVLVLVPAAAAEIYPRPADARLLARAPSAEERLAESVGRRLTRLPVVVRCSTAAEAPGLLGVTPFLNDEPRGYFLLMPFVCRQLARFRANPVAYDPAACAGGPCVQQLSLMTQSLQTVAHESYHALGFEAEATAECYGMQSLWFVARTLGASVPQSEALAAWYWRYQYPAWRLGNHTQYWSAQCRDGGRLDLRLRSHAWPS